MFHPFYQKVFSSQSAILLNVPPVEPENLFLSVCNPPQYSTHCTRKSLPVSLQSSSIFHPLCQKVFSCQSAILLSVPPIVPESLFLSVCNTLQCSTRFTRKSFPLSLQSSSVFHPFGQKDFPRQNAILVSVLSLFYSSHFPCTLCSSVSNCSTWVYTRKVIVPVNFAFYDFPPYAGYLCCISSRQPLISMLKALISNFGSEFNFIHFNECKTLNSN